MSLPPELRCYRPAAEPRPDPETRPANDADDDESGGGYRRREVMSAWSTTAEWPGLASPAAAG
jgi:hypothetical protein